MTGQQSTVGRPLIDKRRVRQLLGECGDSTVDRHERAGRIPPHIKLLPNGPKLWFLDEIEAARDALAAQSAEMVASPNRHPPPPRKKKRPVLIRREQLEEVS